MNARWLFSSTLCALFALSTSATNSVAQDYVAGVLSFAHNATGLAAATVPPGSTRYLAAIDGASATSAQGDIYKIVIPRKGVLRNLYWRAVSSGLAGSGHTITVLKQTPPAAPVPTALAVTWNGTTPSGSNTTDSDSVNAGDVISVRVILTAGGTGLVRPTVSFEYSVAGTVGSQWTTSGSDIYYNTGNVSVGTATTGRTLTVNGSIRADTIIFASDGSVQTTAATGGGGGTNSLNAADGDPTDAVFVDDNGNVGIGTTTPQEKLTRGPGSNSATEMFTPTGVTANVVMGGNLSNGTYYFKIVATDGVGTTVGSAEVSRPITGSPSGYRRVVLAWSPVQGATGYRIYKGSTPAGQDVYHISPTNSFNYDSDAGTDTGSVPTVTTAYVNRVAASGPSWITGGNFGVGTTVPQEELTLASGSNLVTEMASPGGVSAAVISGGNLPVGTHYFRIVASDGVGATAGSAEVAGVVSNATNDRIQLTWSPVLGAVKYRVYGGTTPGGQSVYHETTNTTFDYDSHSGPGATAGSVPSVTTAYINKLSAAANSWLLGGNIGIGTANPAVRLSVDASSPAAWLNRTPPTVDTSAREIARFQSVGDHQAYISVESKWGLGRFGIWNNYPAIMTADGKRVMMYDTNNDLHHLYTNGAERITVDRNGNVGIGTTNPNHLLHLQGTVAAEHVLERIQNSDNSGYSTLWLGTGNDGILRGGSSAAFWTNQLAIVTSGSSPIVLATNATERLRIDGNGNVGIGTGGPLVGAARLTVVGDFVATGTKGFVQPHPRDSAKEIVYVALEGGEAGTYTRGAASLVNGRAVVNLPEHFGLVTGEENLTVQLTPRGTWLRLFVVSVTTKQIVVGEAGGLSGEFAYLIQGVRKGYETHQVVRDRPH